MTAPDSRDSVERIVAEMRIPHEGGWDNDDVDALADRLQALARGPQQAGGEDAEIREIMFGALDRDRDNITTRNLVVVAVNSLQRERDRAEAAEAALREESARLDWLIENRHLFTACSGQWFAVAGASELVQRDTARAAIDAARADEGQTSDGRYRTSITDT